MQRPLDAYGMRTFLSVWLVLFVIRQVSGSRYGRGVVFLSLRDDSGMKRKAIFKNGVYLKLCAYLRAFKCVTRII